MKAITEKTLRESIMFSGVPALDDGDTSVEDVNTLFAEVQVDTLIFLANFFWHN